MAKLFNRSNLLISGSFALALTLVAACGQSVEASASAEAPAQVATYADAQLTSGATDYAQEIAFVEDSGAETAPRFCIKNVEWCTATNSGDTFGEWAEVLAQEHETTAAVIIAKSGWTNYVDVKMTPMSVLNRDENRARYYYSF